MNEINIILHIINIQNKLELVSYSVQIISENLLIDYSWASCPAAILLQELEKEKYVGC